MGRRLEGKPTTLSANNGSALIAYTSLRELAAEMAPKVYGSSTMGVKKVDRLDQGGFFIDQVNCRVITSLCADQDTLILRDRHFRQYLFEQLRPEFACAAHAVCELSQV
jgi:hypothetical protein